MSPPAQPPSKQHGDVLTEISDGMVALLKEYYGVGPTQAKTYYHDDLVVCVLRGGFTRVEQTLLDGDRGRGRDRAAHGVPGGHAPTLRGRGAGGHRQARDRIHERKPAGADMICEVFVLSPTDLVEEREIREAAERRAAAHA